MQKIIVAVAIVAVMAGCASPRPSTPARDLVLLTREGCVNTTTIRANLDHALQAMGQPTDYAVINADTLTTTDTRRGYRTPTVLYVGQDIFGIRARTAAPGADVTALCGRSSVRSGD
jgi:hypothetical protein